MERFNDGVIDLSKLREQKEEEKKKVEPLFTGEATLSFDDADGNEQQYQVVLNLIMEDGRQVLILYQGAEDDPDAGTVAIVEAIIEDGELVGIKSIENEEEYEMIAQETKDFLENLPGTTVDRKDD